MNAWGGKVGEAWIGVHVRGESTDRELANLARRDAQEIADSFDKQWDAETKKRFSRDRGLIARALDQEDPNELVKRFGNWRTAFRQVNEELDSMHKRGEISESRLNDASRALRRMGAVAKETERDQKGLRLEIEKQNTSLARLARQDIAKILTGDHDSSKIGRRYHENAQAMRAMSQAMTEMGRSGKVSVADFDRVNKALDKSAREYVASQNEIVQAEERLRTSRRRALDDQLARIRLSEDEADRVARANIKQGESMGRLTERLGQLRRENKITADSYERDSRRIAQAFDRAGFAKVVEDQERAFATYGKNINESLRQDQSAANQRARIVEEEQRNLTRLVKVQEDRLTSFDRARQKIRKGIQDDLDRDIARMLERGSEDNTAARYRGHEDALERLVTRLRVLREQQNLTSNDHQRVLRRLRAGVKDVEYHNSSLERAAHVWRDADRVIVRANRRIGDTMGRAFGRRSRNDFLHFTGSVVRLASMIPGTLVRAISGIGTAMSDVIGNFHEFKNIGYNTLSSALRGVAPIAAQAAGALVLFAATIGALTTLIPVAVSAITLLVGAITAAVGAIATGLMGTIVVLLPILGAFAVAAGGIAIAFFRGKERADEFKKTLSGFGDVFNDLKKKADPALDSVISSVSRLDDEFRSIGTVGINAVEGMANGFKRFVDNLEDPRMERFYKQWGESIPKIIESFSNGLADLAVGIVAWLTPALDYAERLAGAFERGMETFKEWAMSADGQDTISRWLERAWEAAKDLWGTLVNVSGALFSIFSSATEGAGGDFLSWLERVTGEWKNFLNSEEGQQKMRNFWDDVSDFARDAGDLIGQAWDTFNSLNTETSRENLSLLMGLIESILAAIERWSPAIEAAGSAFVTGVGVMMIALQPFISLLELGLDLARKLGIVEYPEDKLRRFADAAGALADNFGRIGREHHEKSWWEDDVPDTVPVAGPVISTPKLEAAAKEAAYQFGTFYQRAAISIAEKFVWPSMAEGGGPNEVMADLWLADFGNTLGTADEMGTRAVQTISDKIKGGFLQLRSELPKAADGLNDAQRKLLIDSGIGLEHVARERGTRLADSIGNAFVYGMGSGSNDPRMAMLGYGARVGNGLEEGIKSSATGAVSQVGSVMDRIRTQASTGTEATVGVFRGMVGKTGTALAGLANAVQVPFSSAATSAEAGALRVVGAGSNMGGLVANAASSIQGLADAVRGPFSTAALAAEGGSDRVVASGSRMEGLVSSAAASISGLADAVRGPFSSAEGEASAGALRVAAAGAQMSGLVQNAASSISGLADAVRSPFRAATDTAMTGSLEVAAQGSRMEGLVGNAASAISGMTGAVSAEFNSASAAASAGALTVVMQGLKLAGLVLQVASAIAPLTPTVASAFASATAEAHKGAQRVIQAGSNLAPLAVRARAAIAPLTPAVQSRFSATTAAARVGANQIVTSGSNLRAMVSRASAAISGLAGAIRARMSAGRAAAASGAAGIVSAGGNLRGMVGAASAALSGLSGAIAARMRSAYSTASYWAGRIRSAMSSAQANASRIPRMASGGIVYGASTRVVGEAGMEAVVPLNRNLATVDPSVRALSAFAQGRLQPGGDSPRVVVSPGSIIVQSNATDPMLVAEATLDRLVAQVAF